MTRAAPLLLMLVVASFTASRLNAQAPADTPAAPRLVLAIELHVQLGPPLEVGQVERGRRRIVPILGGTFSGPALKGKVLNGGMRHAPPDVTAKLLAGQDVDPSLVYMRTVPTFETSAPELQWLTRSIFIATGERHPNEAVIRVWRVD